MRSISRTLIILVISIFIGCASKIKIDELSIEGDVFDEDTNEGQYYDSDTDIYISNDEWERMNEEAEGIAGALDTMRKQFNDYSQDPSNRWEKYDQYRNQRKQISQRAKDLK